MRFEAFLVFSLVLSFSLVISAQNKQCGWEANNTTCPNDDCCSSSGFCGRTDAYCGEGCQSQCHDLRSLISESTYYEMFPNQYSNDCPSQGFYTYEAFLKAGHSFPAFASVGDDAARKREIAAFLAQTSYETAGVHAVVPLPGRDRFVWGYCHLKEINPTSDYCDPHYACPKEYYGRGPFQLKWNKNYIECGEKIKEDLLYNPDLLVTNAVVSFESALWFWMTPQSHNPSSHEVITGEWTPTEDDKSKGWLPGFGLTTNIINGGNECGNGFNSKGATRIGYFTKYCRLLETTTGDNLDCYDQAPIAPELLAKTM